MHGLLLPWQADMKWTGNVGKDQVGITPAKEYKVGSDSHYRCFKWVQDFTRIGNKLTQF
jgi:hypothetical protein